MCLTAIIYPTYIPLPCYPHLVPHNISSSYVVNIWKLFAITARDDSLICQNIFCQRCMGLGLLCINISGEGWNTCSHSLSRNVFIRIYMYVFVYVRVCLQISNSLFMPLLSVVCGKWQISPADRSMGQIMLQLFKINWFDEAFAV